jgi:hypothetical protein
MLLKFFHIYLLLSSFGVIKAQDSYINEPVLSITTVKKPEIIEIVPYNDSTSKYFVLTTDLYNERWDTLAHPNFWKKVMHLTPDSCVVNVAATRQILAFESYKEWQTKTESEKTAYRDSIRWCYGLAPEERIFITHGQNHFYNFEHVFPSISRGVEVFNDLGVDPFYAQAILLIESPGKLQYSKNGAYGSFQLMKSVARMHGLRVDKYVDERTDFDKSAYGAASLLSKVCIPEAKRILAKYNLTYNETDLWFRLFVMHIYHAGAGNVNGVLAQIQPTTGGMGLIQAMWRTEWGGFKNSSQNYSQLALASILTLNDMIYHKCDYMFECQ